MADGLPQHVRIAIVGTGFSGLGMAIRLEQEGIDDYVLLERGDDVGGTWRDNTYPGCACDVPSHLYSFSFAPNPEWTRSFSPQQEIWDYLRRVAREYGIEPQIRYGCELIEAAWEEGERHWRIETSRGSLTADVLVSGVGALSEPKLPDIPGIDRFEGALWHSAAWNHDHDLTGERVASIGTGASAIQYVPAIQPRVSRLHVFQRTPPWIVPRRDRGLTRFERFVYRRLPPAQLAVRGAIYWVRELFVLGFLNPKIAERVNERVARRYLRREVPDPELRSKLTPRYRMGCKRVLISDDWYAALTQPNVELVTESIREITPSGIVTADGVEREVDVIVFGTGFHVTDMPIADRIRGRDGRTLAEAWDGSPQAYLGATIAGCPNLFMLLGPNTGLAHTSVVFMIESQIEHAMQCLRFMDRYRVATLEVRPDVQAAYNEQVQEQMQGTVWTAGGCESWYLDAHGKNTTLWPDFTFRFRRRTRRFDPADYLVRNGAPAREPVAA